MQNINRAKTLQEYLVKSMQVVLEKLSKMHPDLYVEHEADVNYILAKLHTKVALHLAIRSLPKTWPS